MGFGVTGNRLVEVGLAGNQRADGILRGLSERRDFSLAFKAEGVK